MKALYAVFASVVLCSTSFADVVKTYQGQSSMAPNHCELTLRKADDGSITGFSLKGPGSLQTNFGACENTCQYPDLSEDDMDSVLFQRLQYRVIRADTYPQLTLDSRFVKQDTTMVFISRHLEIDLTADGNPDEVRYTENTEIANMPVDQSRINCDHLQETSPQR